MELLICTFIGLIIGFIVGSKVNNIEITVLHKNEEN